MKIFNRFLFWYGNLWPVKVPKPPYTHINQIGDPILRNRSEPVPVAAITSSEIKKVISSMKSVMKDYECVGLAAPQIGVNKRIIIVEFSKKHLKIWPEEMITKHQATIFPQMVFINPILKVLNMNKISFEEACESVKGYSAYVPRYQEVAVSGYNEEGKEVSMKFSGWGSRIVQHEIDHLDGKFYTDIMDHHTFRCTLWQDVNKRSGKIKMLFTPQ